MVADLPAACPGVANAPLAGHGHSGFTGIEVLRQLSRLHGSNQLIPVVFTSTVGIAGQALPRNDFMHDAQLLYGITQTPRSGSTAR